MGHAVVLDLRLQRHVLADNPVARCGEQLEAAVGLLAAGGDQHRERRARERALLHRRHVVHFAVGDRDHAGELAARHFAKRAVECREEARAARRAVRHGDGAKLEAGKPLGLPVQPGRGPARQRGSSVDGHRRRPIEQKDSDIRQILPGLAHQARPREPAEQHGERQHAPWPAARPSDHRGRGGEDRDGGEQAEHPGRQRRVERQGRDAVPQGRGEWRGEWRRKRHHCPSRSRMAGRWTWSPL